MRATPTFACMLCGRVHVSPHGSYLMPDNTDDWLCERVGPSCVKPMLMSDGLYRYLSDWYRWATTGESPEFYTFDPCYGLCIELIDWVGEQHAGISPLELEDELEDLFIADRLDSGYPFGGKAYHNAERNQAMHKDSNRLRWVRAKLAGHQAATLDPQRSQP